MKERWNSTTNTYKKSFLIFPDSANNKVQYAQQVVYALVEEKKVQTAEPIRTQSHKASRLGTRALSP